MQIGMGSACPLKIGFFVSVLHGINLPLMPRVILVSQGSPIVIPGEYRGTGASSFVSSVASDFFAFPVLQ
jgi:hypothetical protein